MVYASGPEVRYRILAGRRHRGPAEAPFARSWSQMGMESAVKAATAPPQEKATLLVDPIAKNSNRRRDPL